MATTKKHRERRYMLEVAIAANNLAFLGCLPSFSVVAAPPYVVPLAEQYWR